MFGLSENNDNKYPDAAQMGANGAASASPAPSLDTAPPAPVSQPPADTPTGASSVPSLNSAPAPSPGAATTSSNMAGLSQDNSYPASNPLAKDPAGSIGQDKSAAAPAVNSAGGDSDELLKLKQQALQSLAPLVDHLEQDPEEKFKTTMMMIQASDNSDLIPDAYEAASKIPDEKVRAQALLDVVNEINYFTQHAADAK
jgi:hypothetical protein